MKRIDINTVTIKAAENEELHDLIQDAIDTYKQAIKIEGQLYGTRVYGNQTASIEAKVDFTFNKAKVDMLYDLIRYDCIEEINALVGGNIVDMTGTDKQVCRRFYEAFKVIV